MKHPIARLPKARLRGTLLPGIFGPTFGPSAMVLLRILVVVAASQVVTAGRSWA